MSNFLNNFENDEPQEEVITNKRRKNKFLSEHTEIDKNYKQKQKKKYTITIIIALCLMFIGFLGAYKIMHVKMPNFEGKQLSELKSWAEKNKMTLNTKNEFSLEFEANDIIKQPVKKGTDVTKGSQLDFAVSSGADPEEKITLPDFKTMSKQAAEEWLAKNKIQNLKLVSEYNEKVDNNKFLSLELKNDATEINYKRKDSGTLLYSKGKEVYKKDISVPDFTNKLKSDVETWANTNQIEITYKDVASNDAEIGKVLSQSIPEKEKITKKSKMEIELSAGKPKIVPNFAELTAEEAMSSKDFSVLTKQQYNTEVPYGQLISQSIEAGAELTEKDDLNVTVTYSAGKPYLKDFSGENEGTLQKAFYDEYQSKGANIDYIIKYVNSSEPKGTVVGMSASNIYVPLDYTVEISISLGA